jgi:hypothetical protein
VNATPWGTVSVNGEKLESTPLAMDLPAGRYRLHVEHPSKGSDDRLVKIEAGRRQRIDAIYRAP